MNKAELQKYKDLLLKKKESLSKDIKQISKDALNKSQRDATGELSGYTFHMADVATDNYDREFNLGLATQEQKMLWEINEALGRIKDKSYGGCLGCNKPIPKKRLQAMPETKFCIACQSSTESKKTASE